MFDAIVIGGRCAGAPLAMNLARKGRRILLLDAETMPGAPRHAEALTGKAVYRMRDWGLIEDLKACNALPIWKLTLTTGEGAVEIPYWGDMPGLCPRRDTLDSILLGAAKSAGVEVRMGTTVTGLLRDERGRVVGVEGTAGDGTPLREEAKVVVGADGRDSFVAKEVGALEYDVVPGKTCMFRATWDGVPIEGIEMYFLADRAVQVLPTNDNKATIAFIFPVSEFERLKNDIQSEVKATVQQLPGLALRIRCGEPEGGWQAVRWERSFRRHIHGPGWVLAGDAAFFKEPLLAQGINDAFRDADGIAAALEEGFSGGDMHAALDRYQERRDERTNTIYKTTQSFCAFHVTQRMLAGLATYAETLMNTPA